ncbi:MAG: [FeFe] hydrogenase H-cluster radical SAM maturase HydE [Bacteroidales bacterium]|nr:[FeFe] hydrogenase H-cluster radical SAM maturase HydE [Clostridium sp.]MCM1203498.1 [FeFe] hydrogenase H-cluster radical SAM maturase HydE [Bacteroidales bacterium]
MNITLTDILDKLIRHKLLTHKEFVTLLNGNSPELRKNLAHLADGERRTHFGNRIYIRGLIELTNYCKNDCFYCGIRHGNRNLSRYRLTGQDILACCERGYSAGFRTFVLQGGEDPYFTDERMTDIVADIHHLYPDCAITLSLGERTAESYRRLFDAGATRYLLRHETACEAHYRLLHPPSMSFTHRMDCLHALKRIGYQTGCGFMVGSPFQTTEMLAEDLCFIQEFRPHMVGIGPYISHKDTPFADKANGKLEDTLLLISILRIMQPTLLLPATTALGTIAADGREKGILAGANVIMPNLSPENVREQYSLYDHKLCTGAESAGGIDELKCRMESIGYRIVTDRGDSPFTE